MRSQNPNEHMCVLQARIFRNPYALPVDGSRDAEVCGTRAIRKIPKSMRSSVPVEDSLATPPLDEISPKRKLRADRADDFQRRF